MAHPSLRRLPIHVGLYLGVSLDVSLRRARGHSTVTRNFRFIAVHNFRDGLNLYPLKAGGGRSRKSYWLGYSAATDRAIALQVSFIHNDRALVCGSSTGSVSIWQVSTGEQFQSLPHEGTQVTLHVIRTYADTCVGHVMMAVAVSFALAMQNEC